MDALGTVPHRERRILGRHMSPVSAVVTAEPLDGQPVVVSGSSDATVRVWDLTTGPQVGGLADRSHRDGGCGGHRGAS
jgi:WD40 repeat protein